MYRWTTDFQPLPSCFLMCDVRSCGQMLTANVEVGADKNVASTAFIGAAQKLGWLIGIDGHVCPLHAAAMSNRASRWFTGW